jgi:hypothetical protein
LRLLQKHDPEKLSKGHDEIESADLIHMTLVDAAKNQGRDNLAFIDYDEEHVEIFFKHHTTLKGFENSLGMLQSTIKEEIEYDQNIASKLVSAKAVNDVQS